MKNKNIIKIIIIIGIALLIPTIITFSLSIYNNNGYSEIKRIKRTYNIDLPNNIRIEYKTNNIGWFGEGEIYTIINLKEEPIKLLNSFKRVRDDYDGMGSNFDEKYEIDPFSDERNLEFEASFKEYTKYLDIPDKYYPDWDSKYLWKDSRLLIIYFPDTLKLIILEIRY